MIGHHGLQAIRFGSEDTRSISATLFCKPNLNHSVHLNKDNSNWHSSKLEKVFDKDGIYRS